VSGLVLASALGAAWEGPALVGWLALLSVSPWLLLVHRRVGTGCLLVGGFALFGHVRATSRPEVEAWPLVAVRPAQEVRAVVRSVRTGAWGPAARWTRLEIGILDVRAVAGEPTRRGEAVRRLHEDRSRVRTGAGELATGDGLRLSLGRSEQPWEIGDVLVARLRPRRVRGFCNGGRDGWTRRLWARGVQWTAWLPSDAAIERTGAPAPRFVRARGRVGAAIDRALQDPAAAVVRALVIGDKGRLSAALREAFARTGTAHLLAVSGMHLAIVAGGAFWIATRLLVLAGCGLGGAPLSRLAAPASLAMAAVYVGLTGGAVSTVRAFVMAGVVVGGLVARRRASALVALLSALGVLVDADPEALRDRSLQLSFASVAAILAVMSRLRGTRVGAVMNPEAHASRPAGLSARLCAWLVAGVAASLAASLATAPLGAHYFGMVSLVGVPANLVVGPLLGVGSLGLGLLGAIGIDAVPGLSQVCFVAAGALVDAATAVVEEWGGWRWAAVEAHLRGGWMVAAAVTAVAGSLLPSAAVRRGARLGAVLLVAIAWWCTAPPAGVRVAFLDVGQGDAAVVEASSGAAWVIDAGGLGGRFDTGAGVVLPALTVAGVRRVAAVVLSHADRDHYGGMRAVVLGSSPDEFWWNGRGSESSGFRALLAALEERGVTPRAPAAPRRWAAGAGVEWVVLHPRGPAATLSSNDASLVVRMRYGATRVLFPGDVERRGERALLGSGRDLAATVLKVPHHGSRSSSTPAFVNAVRPALAVASAGAFNRFGFPAPEVAGRYRRGGAHFRSTGRWGEVMLTSDGQLERVVTCRPDRGRSPAGGIVRAPARGGQ